MFLGTYLPGSPPPPYPVDIMEFYCQEFFAQRGKLLHSATLRDDYVNLSRKNDMHNTLNVTALQPDDIIMVICQEKTYMK